MSGFDAFELVMALTRRLNRGDRIPLSRGAGLA